MAGVHICNTTFPFERFMENEQITSSCCATSCTCSNEEHVVGPLHALDLVHGDLSVAHVAFQQQGGAADHAIHQEMVLDKVEHFIGHVQGRLDSHLPGVIGHTLWGAN